MEDTALATRPAGRVMALGPGTPRVPRQPLVLRCPAPPVMRWRELSAEPWMIYRRQLEISARQQGTQRP